MALAIEKDLLDLAHETVAVVARRVGNGDCSFHCQMLASKFYEAAKVELHRTSRDNPQRAELLAAVLERCDRAAHPRAAPAMILAQLRTALAMLEPHERPLAVGERGFHRTAPKLRVIQGGLSLAGPR